MIRSYIFSNRRFSKFIIFEIVLASFLFFSVGFLFSSFREFMIYKVKEEIGDYHVIIRGEFIENDVILSNSYNDGRNYIIFKDVRMVYKNTKKVCLKYKCKGITYNESLLSLYGLSKNENVLFVLKRLYYFFILFIGVIIFFILYNSFRANLLVRKKDVCYFKLAGADNSFLFKLFFKEAIILGSISIIIGFGLSFVFSFSFMFFINKILFELFNGNMKLSLYFPFFIFPLIFMFLVVIISSTLPLKDINKYKVMDLFRVNNEYIGRILFKKSLVVFLSKVNFERCYKNFRSLIICVFVFCLSIGFCFIILMYGLSCFKKFVRLPIYDLRVSYDGDYDFSKISSNLGYEKRNIFKSCYLKLNLNKSLFSDGYTNKFIFTDLGGNEIVNVTDNVGMKNGKITHFHYRRFHKSFDISFDNNFVLRGLKLSGNIPFGLEDTSEIIVNLDNENFSNVCEDFQSNMILKTKYEGIDIYFDNLIRKEKISIFYFNAKKVKQIINNLILVGKLFLFIFFVLLFFTLVSTSFSVSFVSVLNRMGDFMSLKALGLDNKKIYFCFLLESFYVACYGFLLSLPFVFIFNKFLFLSIRRVFSFNKIILGMDKILLLFFLSFFSVFISCFLSYKYFYNSSLIFHIKNKV